VPTGRDVPASPSHPALLAFVTLGHAADRRAREAPLGALSSAAAGVELLRHSFHLNTRAEREQLIDRVLSLAGACPVVRLPYDHSAAGLDLARREIEALLSTPGRQGTSLMSGFAVVVRRTGEPVPTGVIDVMRNSLLHRAPDGVEVAARDNVAVVSGRLHATPEARFERQPHECGDGTWFIADARLDNRAEVMGWLGWSRPAASTSDVELLAAWYERAGKRAAQQLLGDFVTVAVEPGGRVVCFRDHLGVKPLYYWVDDEWMVIGSELRQIAAHPAAPRSPDVGLLGEYLSGWVESTTATVIQGVRRLPAAHGLVIDERGRAAGATGCRRSTTGSSSPIPPSTRTGSATCSPTPSDAGCEPSARSGPSSAEGSTPPRSPPWPRDWCGPARSPRPACRRSPACSRGAFEPGRTSSSGRRSTRSASTGPRSRMTATGRRGHGRTPRSGRTYRSPRTGRSTCRCAGPPVTGAARWC